MEHLVKVVTDSACDLPDRTFAERGIGMVPLTIRFDDQEFVDRVELSTADFWTRAAQTNLLPSTAAPSAGAFAEAFRAAKVEGATGVVCVTLSGDLSFTHQAAISGAQLVADEIEVRVVDSRSCTVAEASVVLAAVDAAEAGKDLDAVVAVAVSAAAHQHLYGALDTLDNLRKGGRIGAAGAFFAALLSVKPIITIEDGVVKPKARQRTRSRALKALAELVTEQGPVTNVGVAHSGAPDLEEFLDLLAPAARRENILVTEMGPTIGVHGGPRLIAVTFASAAP